MSQAIQTGALIVQGDGTVLLDLHDPGADEARDAIAPFAELEKSPEHMHSYRLTPLSLWNAAGAGLDAEEVLRRLHRHARYAPAEHISVMVRDTVSRFGKLVLEASEDPYKLTLLIFDEDIAAEIRGRKKLHTLLHPFVDDTAEAAGSNGERAPGGAQHGEADTPQPADRFMVKLADRGTVKQELIHIGYPVKDLAPLREGDPIAIPLRSERGVGGPFVVRDYQSEAVAALLGDRGPGTGFGTVVLPCGAGKTVVGMQAMSALATNTLVLTTNVAAVHQWMDELLDKTELAPEDIGEYTGDTKNIRPVTIATYQVLVWRKDKESEFPHFDIFRKRKWGLIIYDEVHLLPAPVFRVTAELQAVRRLGLTATLVREDGREADVFSLVGPKRYDVPWKELESRGWIAEAHCHEIRIDLPKQDRSGYAASDKRGKFRIASINPAKIPAAQSIIENHPDDHILVIGQYLEQLDEIAAALNAPLITGRTPNKERERIYREFREGKTPVIVVSKVANFAIDLPDASVAVQISGSFGSRQEEAQRLGRILRPKKRNSHFYTIVSRYTVEEEFAVNRQRFLTEQGYKYHIDHWDLGDIQ